MSIHKTTPEQEVAYLDLCALVSKHRDTISAMELLAIASNMVGKLIAMQDQRGMTSDLAMEIVLKNIEYGNKQVMEQIGKTKGSA
jgi:hypothetical protein